MPALQEIRQQDAPGEIAQIYSEIMIASGLPMVNLIWRHFAALPGVLRWAWDTVSPVVRSTAMDGARQRIVTSIRIPPIVPLGVDDLRSVNLTGQSLEHVSSVISAYLRGNLTNMVALTALRMRLDHPERPAARFIARTSSAPAQVQLDPLPRIDSLDAWLAAQIRDLALHHEGASDDLIPSLYLALARWPDVINALPAWLSSLYEPTAMRAAQANTCNLAEAEAAAMLPQLSPLPEGISAAQPALQRFTRILIPSMVPICVALRWLLPEA